MRITTGVYKGRQLKAPAGIRPTEDRVRKAFFDIMGDCSGLSFLELYAGSGAMGLEALSRGAQSVTFVEKDRKAVEMIEKNLALLGQDAVTRARVIHHEADRVIPQLAEAGKRFDLVFLDPPYYRDMAEKTLQLLGGCDIVNHSGYVVVQHFCKDRLSARSGRLIQFKQTKYGETVLSFYEAESGLSGNI